MARQPGSVTKSVSLREQRRRQLDLLSQNHILDAAEAVFAEKGFPGATVKEIAEAAEFSVGAVYNFFDGKAQLFAAVMSRRNDEFRAILDTALQREAPARQQLQSMVDVILDYYLSHDQFYRLFQRAIGGAWLNIKASFNEVNYRQYLDVMALESAVFAAGVRSGEFRDEDPEMMAAIFSGIMQAYLAKVIIEGAGGQAGSDSRQDLMHLLERAFWRTPSQEP
jgi:TetR/AcrR family transcriptional regulator